MNDDKAKRLQLTLWDIQKRWGQQALSLLSTMERADASTVIRTGIDPFDALLGENGIPRGKVTQMLGIPTTGMTTFAHKISAHAQREQSAAAYIDLNGSFDPDYAWRCGVALDRLLLVRPESLTQALEIARDLFKEGKLSLVVLDLLSDRRPAKPRDFAALLRRMHEPLAKSASAALFLLPPSPPTFWQSLDEYTHLQLLLGRQAWLFEADDICGYRLRISILKDKARPGTRQITFDLNLDELVKGDSA